MAISPGTRVGPYEITALIGAGGMGEVYRATDTNLKRTVAIKVLPEAVATDAERLARFQREAEVLARLNHPNIAQIHGLEKSDGTTALVMELVEGPTLADRIAHGSIPLGEALPIARQIAEALEAAHEQGIIHRDLKPANIKVKDDGTVKVLDFGLAKALEPTSAGGIDATASPTITSPALLTGVGMMLGTAAYMSPEQARGLAVDKRTDIWAFGCVLYEMITGTHVFGGNEVTDTLAFIITKEPNWNALPPNTPAGVRRLLRRCLQKDPSDRLRDMGDARIEVLEALAGPTDGPAATRVDTRRSKWSPVATVVAAMAAVVIATGATWLATRPSPPRVTRTMIVAPPPAALTVSGLLRDVAITPDGTRIVYIGGSAAQLTFFVRSLDQLETTPLTVSGVGQPSGPFLSPDGQWIGFFDGFTALKKVAIGGGPAVLLCRLNGVPFGATWGPDGTIVFSTSNVESGLQQVSAEGGDPTVLVRPNSEPPGNGYLWPEFFPGGRALLFTIAPSLGEFDRGQVAVFDLQTRTQKVLVRGGSHADYVSSGHLVYGAAGTLHAVAFDLDRLEVNGAPVPVVPQVVMTASGLADFDVARDGTLVYVSGSSQALTRTLAWVDRQGREEPLPAPPRAYTYPRISPDGTRAALDIRDQENDIWVWDFGRATLTRLTFDPTFDRYPIWTPDGRRVLFAADRAGAASIFWQTADGTGAAERLTQGPRNQFPDAISPDGARVVLEERGDTGGRNLMELAMDKEHRVQPLVQNTFEKRNADLSPEGRWLAYESDESGRFEVYVRPFPDVNGGRWQVSTDGGSKPVWARSGQELFYVTAGGALMSVGVDRSSTWSAGNPTRLFARPYFFGNSGTTGRTYDVSPDGRRFLMIKPLGGSEQSVVPPSIVVVQNWHEELKRLVPTK